ncbi:MAG: secretin N-terminal domain-containing protein [Verrucomicrobiia bacterium]
MKTLILRTFLVACVLGRLASAVAQTMPGEMTGSNTAPAAPNQSMAAPMPDTNVAQPDGSARNGTEALPTPANPAPVPNQSAVSTGMPETATTDIISPGDASGTNYDALSLNFRNVPLEMVLNYLSEAAGFIIVLDTPVSGTVSVISSHPMNRDEAVDLLNSVLNKNGFAAIRNGRTLTIVSKNDAKTRNIPVKTSNDPDSIPDNAEIVTQIIPIRFVEARQLVTDLSSFVSPQATIVANEAGNSIVVTDTQSNIRHLTEIIRAIDNSAEGETEIRVFHLTHASPADVANELGQIFPSNNGSGNQVQTPFRFGGGGGGFGGFPGFGGFGGRGGGGGGGGSNATANNGSNSRVQKQSQVVAVADLRTSSVVVTASKDLMQEIAGMMEQLDVPSTRDQKVFVYHMNNGDPQQTLQVLQNMFGGNNTSRTGTSSSSQNSALMSRQTQNATSGGTGSSTSTTGTGIGGNSRGASGSAF